MFAVRLGMAVHGVFDSEIEATLFLITIKPIQINGYIITPDLFQIEEKDFVTEDGKRFFQREKASRFLAR
jgi:hypothetical protein